MKTLQNHKNTTKCSSSSLHMASTHDQCHEKSLFLVDYIKIGTGPTGSSAPPREEISDLSGVWRALQIQTQLFPAIHHSSEATTASSCVTHICQDINYHISMPTEHPHSLPASCCVWDELYYRRHVYRNLTRQDRVCCDSNGTCEVHTSTRSSVLHGPAVITELPLASPSLRRCRVGCIGGGLPAGRATLAGSMPSTPRSLSPSRLWPVASTVPVGHMTP